MNPVASQPLQALIEQARPVAFEQADAAAALGEVPVGAVILSSDGRLLGVGHNRTRCDFDPTAHAEVVALRQAALAVQNYRLSESLLYVTLEPCMMCLGAMVQARVTDVIFALRDDRAGVCGSVMAAHQAAWLNHHIQVHEDIEAAEASKARLQGFFRARRQNRSETIAAMATLDHLPNTDAVFIERLRRCGVITPADLLSRPSEAWVGLVAASEPPLNQREQRMLACLDDFLSGRPVRSWRQSQ